MLKQKLEYKDNTGRLFLQVLRYNNLKAMLNNCINFNETIETSYT